MEEILLKKRIAELRKRAEFSFQTEFTDFLNLSEIDASKMMLSGSNYMFYGGSADAERLMLCIAPEHISITADMFPICGVRIIPKNVKFAEEFSHRDVLGSVLGLGLERAVIGDIYVKEKEAYVFCVERIADFLVSNLVQVKHTNVVCNIADAKEAVFSKEFQVIQRTVSANRIDAVVAAAFGVSRGVASSAISGGKVFLNGREITSPSVIVKEQEIISFRGYGKVKLKEIGGLTKKGRISVVLERYQ